MSFNITPVASGHQEIHPYSAMNIDSVKINTSLIMMKECDIQYTIYNIHYTILILLQYQDHPRYCDDWKPTSRGDLWIFNYWLFWIFLIFWTTIDMFTIFNILNSYWHVYYFDIICNLDSTYITSTSTSSSSSSCWPWTCRWGRGRSSSCTAMWCPGSTPKECGWR